MQFHQVAQAGLFFASEFDGRLVVQGAKEVAFLFGKAVELDFAGSTMQIFELMQSLVVHAAPDILALSASHSTAKPHYCKS
jgi:hypothetical protein